MKNTVLFLFLIFSISNFGQNKTLNLDVDNTFEFSADSFVGLDGFQNYYFLKNNVLIKYFEGTTKEYQNLSLGKLTKVDVTNPLKIVLFYEAFNTIQLLDNQLNEIQKIDFNQLETPIINKCAGISGQNKIWTFDTNTQQIGLYDLNTNSYKTIGNPITKTLEHYFTDFNLFYWIDSESNWHAVSIYGNTTDFGSIEKLDALQIISSNNFLYSDNSQLYVKNRTNGNIITIEIVEKSFKNFYYKDQILSIFTDKGITNYKILIP